MAYLVTRDSHIKRIALDFKWPIGQVWKGYLNPYRSQECKACDQTGYNDATRKLDEDWFSFNNENYISRENGSQYNNNAWQYHLTEIEIGALVKKGYLKIFTHNWESGKGWTKKEPEYMPTPNEVNTWAINTPLGHDSEAQWICVKARAKHLGVYGVCEYCNGKGEIWSSAEIKKLHDNWEPYDPPSGDGYQLWDSCGEELPLTPVFKTKDELVQYCLSNNIQIGFDED